MSIQHLHTNHFIPYVISMKTLMKVSYEKTPLSYLMKFCMFLSLYTTDYLIRLAFWAFPIGL